MIYYYIISGWWFGTFFIFPYIGYVIIPIDFHIFQRGRYTTNQIRFCVHEARGQMNAFQISSRSSDSRDEKPTDFYCAPRRTNEFSTANLQNLRAVFPSALSCNDASDGGKEANFSTNMIGDMGGRSLLRVLFTHKIAAGPHVWMLNCLGIVEMGPVAAV